MPAGSQFHACALFSLSLVHGSRNRPDLKDIGVRRRLLLCQTNAFLFVVPAATDVTNDAKSRDLDDRGREGTGATLINNVKRWGRWATLGLGLIAALVGQMAALTALIWWNGLDPAQLLDLVGDGVAVTLIVCISTPVQVLLLALIARQTGANAADYLGLRLPRKSDVVVGIIVVVVFIAVARGPAGCLGAISSPNFNSTSIARQALRAGCPG